MPVQYNTRPKRFINFKTGLILIQTGLGQLGHKEPGRVLGPNSGTWVAPLFRPVPPGPAWAEGAMGISRPHESPLCGGSRLVCAQEQRGFSQPGPTVDHLSLSPSLPSPSLNLQHSLSPAAVSSWGLLFSTRSPGKRPEAGREPRR